MQRRRFIETVAVTGTSFLVGPGLSASAFYKGSPNKKVVPGIMGINGRCSFLAQKLAAIPNAEIGYRCDVDSIAMNIAQRVGRVLNSDTTNSHIMNDAETTKLWSREYAPGWNLKV